MSIHMAERPTFELKPLLLPPRQAAETLFLSERTLWSLTAPRGPIPCVRIGRAVRYAPEDLRAWIEAAKETKAA